MLVAALVIVFFVKDDKAVVEVREQEEAQALADAKGAAAID